MSGDITHPYMARKILVQLSTNTHDFRESYEITRVSPARVLQVKIELYRILYDKYLNDSKTLPLHM